MSFHGLSSFSSGPAQTVRRCDGRGRHLFRGGPQRDRRIAGSQWSGEDRRPSTWFWACWSRPRAGFGSKALISREHRGKALEFTNFAAVYAPLPGNLTVYQNLRIFGLMYAVKQLKGRIEALLDQFDLREVPRREVRRALFGRADARGAGQGADQRSAIAAAG